jgi:ParB family chromosome partitioning protein
MKVLIESVVVKGRVRTDMGDLASLKASLERFGQLSPILLTRENELIAGHRRLEAAKGLGWESIEASYVDQDSELEKLEIELQENMQRKDFTAGEIFEGLTRLEKLRRPNPVKRMKNFLRSLFKRKKPAETDAEVAEQPEEAAAGV